MRTRTVALCVTAAAVLAGTTGCGAHHAHSAHPGGASPATTGTQQARARQAVNAAAQALAGKHFAAFTAVSDIYGKHSTVKGTCTWGPGALVPMSSPPRAR